MKAIHSKRILIRSLTAAFVIAIGIYGCKKDKTTEVDYDTQTSQDNALAEATFNDAGNITAEAMDGSGSLSTYRISETESILSSCATLSLTPDSSGNGGTITVDFGPNNCRCNDYRLRRGVINIHFTGFYRDSGTVVTTTFNNYYVGNFETQMFKVEGTKTLTNMGHNNAGNMYFTIHVSNAHITNAAGAVMTWNTDRTREWIAGESTLLNWTDDVYVVTGSASGTNFEQNSFTVNIVRPLHIDLSCHWITDGSFDLTPSGKATRTLDYGTGTCDSLATVTVNSTSFQIVLR